MAQGKTGGIGMKRCPQCGEVLFEDMDVCYGCLYDFSRGRGEAGGPPGDLLAPVSPEDSTVACDPPWGPAGGLSGTGTDEGLALEPVSRSASATDGAGLSMRIRSESMEVTLPLPQDGLLVGRGGVCDVILHARAVSRHHVRIVPHGQGAIVEDCGSTNRARLRGQEVEGSMTMEVGDVLDVCGTLFFLLSGRRA